MHRCRKSDLPRVRRTAGQSIREEKQRLTDDRIIPYYFVTAFAWALFGLEVMKAATHVPPQPLLFFCLALCLTGVTAIVFLRLYDRFHNLNRGEIGELKVAEILEELRPAGYRVIHDIPRTGFNVDHVIVGPAGVFVVETKFRSGFGQIEFRDGEGLFVNDRREENDVLSQARGNAREIRKMIREDCGISRWVTPLVVFVGDWKVKNNWLETDARVLTLNQLGRYLHELQPELTSREIQLIATHLERSAKN